MNFPLKDTMYWFIGPTGIQKYRYYQKLRKGRKRSFFTVHDSFFSIFIFIMHNKISNTITITNHYTLLSNKDILLEQKNNITNRFCFHYKQFKGSLLEHLFLKCLLMVNRLHYFIIINNTVFESCRCAHVRRT
jgi:hypothetical protein